MLGPTVAIASMVLVVAPTALAPPAQAASPASTYAAKAVRATNEARVDQGLKELRDDECLHGFAVRQAARMAAREELVHQDLGAVIQACGLFAAGENVAYGFPTGGAVVRRGWLRSPGHRANILSTTYRLVAVGARRSEDGTWYAAQVFGRRS